MDVLAFIYICRNKGSCDATLFGLQSKQNFKYQHQLNCSPLNYRIICFKEVNTMNLLVSSNTKTSFEFVDKSIRVMLYLEGLSRINNIGSLWSINDIPDSHLLQCLNFFYSGFPVFIGKMTFHCFPPVWITPLGCFCLGLQE